MKRLSAAFYIILAALTVAVLGALAAWLRTEHVAALIATLVLFAGYIAFLAVSLARGQKRGKKESAELARFRAALKREDAKILYLSYSGNEKRLRKPSETKRDYYLEIFTEKADPEDLKKYLWDELSEERERELELCSIECVETTYAILGEIEGMTVMLSKEFYEIGKETFSSFFKRNKLVFYGDEN